jgi:FkbM family methyltransferase
MIDCICSHAVNHPTFIDIGAHSGLITTAVADRFNYCLAVEPAPANLARLQQAVSSRKLENCRVVPCALGEREGFAALHLSEVSNGDDTLARRDDLTRSITVPVTTLDLLIEESKVAGPFFIKIDVQGYELMVFLGGERTLAESAW